MNIKEQIRAEIERRKNTAETMRERGAYIGLLDYLDTLPEQPESTIMTNEMLMGEIKPKKKSNALFDKCVENCDPAVMKEVSDNADKMLGRQPVEGLDVTDFCKPIDPGIAQCVADHWWEMIDEESTNKKPVEGLEEAADAHAFFAANQPGQDWETHDVTDAFKAGAEWMKSKYEK